MHVVSKIFFAINLFLLLNISGNKNIDKFSLTQNTFLLTKNDWITLCLGSSINDVTQVRTIFIPPPPIFMPVSIKALVLLSKNHLLPPPMTSFMDDPLIVNRDEFTFWKLFLIRILAKNMPREPNKSLKLI